MIPPTITRDHVLQALAQIDASSVPPPRQSMDYDLVHDGRRYPPKYVVGLAAHHATGTELVSTEFNSVESRAFLERLGFTIDRRTKAPPVGTDSTPDVVRQVFERLVPDAPTRALCHQIFADTIEQAHSLSEASWEITLHRNFIRLNGGRVILFDIEPRTAFVGLDPTLLDDATKATLEAVADSHGAFQLLPGFPWYRLPHAKLHELWPALRDAFRTYVAKATLTARQSVWASSHAPAVVVHLSDVVARPLPQPLYGEVERGEGFWMFHANPRLYEVREATRRLPELNWRVKQHESEIRVGDTVFLWEAGSQRGVVAVATVLTEPAVMPFDPAGDSFRKAGLDDDEDQVGVRLKITQCLDPIIDGDDMLADPTLARLPAFTAPQRTNSRVSRAQGALLLQWARGNRPPRILKVAPGNKAELWEQCLSGGYICVGWDDVGDLRQYPDWRAFRNAFAATSEVGKAKGHVTLKAQELWAFRNLRPGDKVVANRGLSRVLGVGTVKEPGYAWDASRAAYKHTVRVDWDTSVACDIPPHAHWGVTTVDNVPPAVVAMVLPDLNGQSGGAADDLGSGRGSVGPSEHPPAEKPFTGVTRSLREAQLWFSTETVAHYLLALQTKRFVILTGISGTGKTHLALAVAKHFQPRTRRMKAVPPPAGAVVKRVSPSMAQYRRMVIPSAIAMALRHDGLQATGTGTVDVMYPGGSVGLPCYRHVRSTHNTVHHLSLKGGLAEWIDSLPIGEEIYIELEPTGTDLDRIRFTLPKREEEVTVTKNYEVVAVRPDWTDGHGLLGFHNPLTRRYVTTPFLQLVLAADAEARAAKEENRAPNPFFVILDEMNLARVEQYFSDFLSALESEEEIVLHSDQGIESGDAGDDEEDDAVLVPRRVKVPANLFFTGTVNVDETTHMFSPKVLDRAFVIEFNEVDLEAYGTRDEGDDEDEVSALELDKWQGFPPFEAVSGKEWSALASVAGGDIRKKLTELHGILGRDNRHFGYRVANEIGRFIKLAEGQSADPVEAVQVALDLAILSKVLPKLHGTQQELEQTLIDLFRFAVGSASGEWTTWEPREGALASTTGEPDAPEPDLPRTSLKLWRMLRRLRAQGFTSFIE